MELKSFISQALTNVVQGVEEANKTVNRFKLASSKHEKHGSGQEIEFDVSVTVSKDSQDSIDGKIGIAFAQIGGDIKKTETNENIHRMKFKIFITEE